MDVNVTEPMLTEVTEIVTAVVSGVVAMAEIADFFDRSFSELTTTLAEQGRTATGAAFARYKGLPGETADLEVGFATDQTVTHQGNVQPSSLPSCRVATTVHVGGYDQLGMAWERLGAWIREQGLTPRDDLWEVYVTKPNPHMDPADLRTELFWTTE